MNVILYSTHCPKCNVLSKKLNEMNITYTEVDDADIMIAKGFTQAPMLEVNGTIMNFSQAIEWVNEQ